MFNFLKKLFGSKDEAASPVITPITVVEETKAPEVKPVDTQPAGKPEVKKPKKTASTTRKPSTIAKKPRKVREPKV